MSLKKYSNGMWENVNTIKRYSNGEWVNCSFVKRYIDGEWKTIYPSEYFLIKNGTFVVDFTVIPLWKNMAGGVLTDNVTVSSAGYINLYNSGYSDMATMITVDAIDLSGYSTLNIEADAQVYLLNASHENNARCGAFSSIPAATMEGSPVKYSSGILKYGGFYRYSGVANSTTYYTADGTLSLSGINSTGHIFVDITCWNYDSEYSNLRIKNMWLS